MRLIRSNGFARFVLAAWMVGSVALAWLTAGVAQAQTDQEAPAEPSETADAPSPADEATEEGPVAEPPAEPDASSVATPDGPAPWESTEDAALPEEVRLRARDAYRRAQELFRVGDHEGAEAAFQEAYDAVRAPVLLLALAEVRERAGNAPGAVAMLERYLAERADAPDRAAIEMRVADLRQTPATVVVVSHPPGARVWLDDEAVMQEDGTPARTPTEIEVAPGEHRLALRLEDHEKHEEGFGAQFGSRIQLEATLSSVAPEPVPLVSKRDDDEVPTGVWVASGIAAAGVVTGTVLGFLALSEQSDFDDRPSDATADRGERLALFADVAFGVGVVSGITALVLYLTRNEQALGEDEEDTGLVWVPTVGPHGSKMSARVRF